MKELQIQVKRIREHFNSDVRIVVFCNNPNTTKQMHVAEADNIIAIENNSGHHGGVRDAHNSMISQDMAGFDWFVSSHADCCFTDMSIVSLILEQAENLDHTSVQLNQLNGLNVHRPSADQERYVFHDFLAIRPAVFKSIIPINDECDVDIGIEMILARKLDSVGSFPFVIPCVHGTLHGARTFMNLLGKDVHLICDNNMDNKRHALKQIDTNLAALHCS